MTRQTVIIIVSPVVECWGNFKKMCEAKGWKHQTLCNKGLNPKVTDELPKEINGHFVKRVNFK